MESYPIIFKFIEEFDLSFDDEETKYLQDYENYIQTSQINNELLLNIDGYYETFIGRCLLYLHSNYDDCLDYFHIAVEKNNHHAMYELGWYYDDFFENKYSLFLAEKYYKMAEEYGNVSAVSRLGTIYLGSEKYYNKGIRYLDKAHKLGNRYCSYELGMEYMEKDDEEKMLYYLSFVLEDENNDMYDHAVGNLICFYNSKKDFNKVIDFAYLDWVKNKKVKNFFPIQKEMRKLVDLSKLLDISVKINDFKEFSSRDIFDYFANDKMIDEIYPYIKDLSITNIKKNKLIMIYKEKYKNLIEIMDFNSVLQDDIKEYIIGQLM